jgi:mannose-1-phosphate guanylyltransferase
MIQSTVDRLASISPPDRTLIITGSSHAEEVKRQLPQLPKENIIPEPVGRNTAPCVALAAMIVEARNPDAIMAVFPADHHIESPQTLNNTIVNLARIIDEHPDKLGTIGIKPSFPETGYGYIKQGEPLSGDVCKVEEFLEKPEFDTAKTYVETGQYLWNAGMFFWKANTIVERFEKYMPELFRCMLPIKESIDGTDFTSTLSKVYPGRPSQSIDYGVMERAGGDGDVIVAPCDPGWNDVGSWRSLYDLMDADNDGNRSVGKLISVNSKGVVTHNSKRLVAAVGLEDVIVVETEDAILVLNKEQSQDVRAVTDKLSKEGLDHLL